MDRPACGLLDGLNDSIQALIRHYGFDLDLGQEIDDVLRAAVQLGVALLPSEAFDFSDGDARHACL